jgi:hypothetical protein
MNYWTDLSVVYASQRSYLDDLFQLYPTIPEGIRDVDTVKWQRIEDTFQARSCDALIRELLALPLFPIKDSYVAYLKRDSSAIDRNPKTIARLCGRLYEMGLPKLYERCTEPKETNRQIGPLFRRWLESGALGLVPVSGAEMLATTGNAVLAGWDAELKTFAISHLGYGRDKGLDFIGRFNGKYVIGEAKFLTDFGGHQNAQFADAMATLADTTTTAVKIAILDGVLYIPGNNKMFRDVTTTYAHLNIMSGLVLREFLYQI